MRRIFIVKLCVVFFCLAVVTAVTAQNPSPVTTVTVTDDVVLPNAKRFGMNVGFYDQFGAAQFLKNMVPNPGFEGGEVASVFIADAGASGNRIRAQGWTVRQVQNAPEMDARSYFNGGQLEILTGPGRGRVSQIVDVDTGDGGFNFVLAGGGIAPNPGDIIAVRGNPIPGYYMTNRNAKLAFDTTTEDLFAVNIEVGPDELLRINRFTDSVSLVGPLEGVALASVEFVPNVVPEPTALASLLVGVGIFS